MKAWLFNQLAPKQVFERSQAAEMTEREASEMVPKMQRLYPERSWGVVRVETTDKFVVEGTPKQQ